MLVEMGPATNRLRFSAIAVGWIGIHFTLLFVTKAKYG